jgi:hypothetical protein
MLAGALAMLGLMVQVSADELAAALITTAFAAGAVAILQSWRYLLDREDTLRKTSIDRMRSLEGRLGFRRQALVQKADDKYKGAFLGETTTDWLISIGWFAEAGWIVVAVWRWAIYAGVLD